jgi:hypothetical protein
MIRSAQQRNAIVEKPLRRQAHKTRHRQPGVAGQLHKFLPLLRRNANLNAIIEHARSLRAYKNPCNAPILRMRGNQMTSLTPPKRPTAAEIARDPLSLWRWMDDSAGYAILEAFRELNEERKKGGSDADL